VPAGRWICFALGSHDGPVSDCARHCAEAIPVVPKNLAILASGGSSPQFVAAGYLVVPSPDGAPALRALDMQLAWGPAIEQPRGAGAPDRQYGNALLSRLPILISDVHPLPGSGEPRSALRTLVELDGGTLWVTTTHLTRSGDAERAEQLAVIAGLHSEAMEAGVVVGDFNTPADAPELAELRPLFDDAWELARDKQDRSRWKLWQHDAGFTHPAGSPHRRIDQCWVTHGVGVASARVVDAHAASDHLPLVVDLEIPSGV